MNEAGKTSNRRHLFRVAAAGGAALSLLGTALAWARSLVPNVLYEPPLRRRIGLPSRFPEGHTYLSDEKIFQAIIIPILDINPYMTDAECGIRFFIATGQSIT